MRKRLLRMVLAVAALCIGLIAFNSSETRAAGSCRNVAPFCSNVCSCGGMRCTAKCDDGCDWPEEQGGDRTVWCEDIF